MLLSGLGGCGTSADPPRPRRFPDTLRGASPPGALVPLPNLFNISQCRSCRLIRFHRLEIKKKKKTTQPKPKTNKKKKKEGGKVGGGRTQLGNLQKGWRGRGTGKARGLIFLFIQRKVDSRNCLAI